MHIVPTVVGHVHGHSRERHRAVTTLQISFLLIGLTVRHAWARYEQGSAGGPRRGLFYSLGGPKTKSSGTIITNCAENFFKSARGISMKICQVPSLFGEL
jgi:hypothetical protein